MKMIIRDPDTMKGAGVDTDGRSKVISSNEERIAAISREEGEAYSWSNVSYDYAAADTIVLVKNTSSTKKLHVTDIFLSGSTATIATIHRTTCTTPTGTAITGINLNGSFSNVASATAIGDETTNVQGSIIQNVELRAVTVEHIKFDGALILNESQCIAVDYVTDGTTANVTIRGYFK